MLDILSCLHNASVKKYTVSVINANPHPNEVVNELNNYASLGWQFKNTISYLDGSIMLIFERDD